jgi:hypothetical protein
MKRTRSEINNQKKKNKQRMRNVRTSEYRNKEKKQQKRYRKRRKIEEKIKDSKIQSQQETIDRMNRELKLIKTELNQQYEYNKFLNEYYFSKGNALLGFFIVKPNKPNQKQTLNEPKTKTKEIKNQKKSKTNQKPTKNQRNQKSNGSCFEYSSFV